MTVGILVLYGFKSWLQMKFSNPGNDICNYECINQCFMSPSIILGFNQPHLGHICFCSPFKCHRLCVRLIPPNHLASRAIFDLCEVKFGTRICLNMTLCFLARRWPLGFPQLAFTFLPVAFLCFVFALYFGNVSFLPVVAKNQ